MAFPAKAMEAAAATAATPKSFNDDFTVSFIDAAATVGILTTVEGLEDVDLRPVKDGIATVAEGKEPCTESFLPDSSSSQGCR
ncbi:hypothetical protein YC2023_090374 [Brassica napus]